MSSSLAGSKTRGSVSLGQLLWSCDNRPTVASYRQAAESLQDRLEFRNKARVAVLSTFTFEPLLPFFEVEAARLGFATQVYQGPFNVVRQELLDPQSGCTAFQPQIVFIAHLLEDVCPALLHDFLTLTTSDVEEMIASTVAEIVSAVNAFRAHSSSNIVVYNFVQPAFPLLGIYENIEPNSQSAAIRQLNLRLATELSTIPNTQVLDFDRICSTQGYGQWRHVEMWYTGRAPLSPAMLVALGKMHAAYLNAVLGTPRKCLVVDLDNTLWGGVVGEDGMAGIQIGQNYPGNIYRDIQLSILQLHRRGVLLAICSKNNEADVDEVFSNHPDMLLRREHFAVARINWKSKASNLQEIADELNIGVDSMVFLDDSPVECELMRQQLPEVMTWEGFDSDGKPAPIRMLNQLCSSLVFDKLTFTKEDRERNRMYRDQVVRRASATSATSLEDFLVGLEMTVDIQPINEFSVTRVFDLIQKTNQFNLTTRRHTRATIDEIRQEPTSAIFTIQARDKFGDNGIVGVAIAHQREEVVNLDTFLLSCRVIGRTIETALLRYIVDWGKGRNANFLIGEFLPTAKNLPAADFFSQHGFARIDSRSEGSRWLLELDQVPFEWPSYIISSHETDDGSAAQMVEDRVTKMVAEVFHVAQASLTDDSSPQSIPHWDSLNHLNLVMAIESEFDLRLSSSEILSMQSVGAIRRLLNRQSDSSEEASLVFVDCRTEDLAEFKEFVAHSYGPTYVLGVNDAYFEWQYAAGSGAPYRLRLAKMAGKIVGCLGYIPVDVHIGCSQYQGSWLANWMVDPDYRHLGIGPLLAREVTQDFDVTLALGANEEAHAVLKGLGWTDFSMLQRRVAVLDRSGAEQLTEENAIDWPVVSYAGRLEQADPSLTVTSVANCKIDAEQLWDRLRGADRTFAGTRRSVSYLNWRYSQHPQFSYRIIEIRRLNVLLGLAVYRVEQARDLDVRVGRIVEFIAEPEVAEAVLQAIIRDAIAQDAVALDFFCACSLSEEIFQAYGFLPGEDSRAQQIPMLYQPIDRRRAGIRFLADLRKVSEAAHVQHWYVTKSDGDQDRPN